MNMWNKNGVSLITVLLFMLVATIAATATFKWLTSENRSSGSRMQQREAYQSAIAGIESARSWMTYHGNDVGSLIKQFEDGNSAPILLNSQLAELTRPGQNFKVWLVGVNTTNSTYKLKLLSKGESRNGSANHHELAILNVDGLYRVNIPKERTISRIPFEYNYYGGSVDETAGGINATSMVVNGNWIGNPSGIQKSFIVTGNATLTGNTIAIGDSNNCIGGNFTAENAGATGGSIYIGGDGLKFSGHFKGDAYFEHDVNIGTGGNGLTVEGSMFLGDDLIMRSQKNVMIEKNLCLTDTANVQLHSELSNPTEFKLKGNLWIPPSNRDWLLPTTTNKVNFSNRTISNAPKSGFTLFLGEKQTGIGAATPKIYMPNGVSCVKYFKVYQGSGEHNLDVSDLSNFGDYAWTSCTEGYTAKRTIGFQAWEKDTYDAGGNYSPGIPHKWNFYKDHWMIFKTSGGDVKGTYTNADLNFSCGEPAKEACSALWDEGTGCGGSSYVVPDILKAVDTTLLIRKTKSAQCMVNLLYNPDDPNGENLNGMNMTVLNNCYASSSADELFHGYLVISDTTNNDKILKMLRDPKGTLNGKFIFYIKKKPNETIKFPPTTSTSSVLVYLPHGASLIDQAGSGDYYKYFVYSLEDVGSLKGDNTWTGSFYFPVSTCARIKNMQTFGMTFVFDSTLIADLTNANLICDMDVDTCGSVSTGGGEGSSGGEGGSEGSEIDFGGVDGYYISNAPQLSISIETQYKNNESEPSSNAESNLQGDFIVLPRVIYLPADAPGYLSDYYNVMRLNKYPAFDKDDGSVTCAAGIPSSGLLAGSGNLASGQYRCQYSYNNKDVPFYVIVGSAKGSDPSIGFTDDFHELEATDSYTVKLHVPPHSTSLTVNFQKADDIDGWNIQPASASVNCALTLCNILIPSNASAQDIDLFNVTTSSAESGTAIFSVRPGVGYNVGVPNTLTLQIQSNLTIYREDATAEQLEAYCSGHDGCPEDISKWPDCQTGESWVTISGSGCITGDINNRWVCATASDIRLVASDDIPTGCIAVVPDEVLLQNTLVKGDERSLHASLKAQQMPFRFGFAGKDVPYGTKILATISSSTVASRNNFKKACVYGTDVTAIGGTCLLDVFTGERVSLSFENDVRPDRFHYWSCSGDNCPVENTDADSIASFAISASNNTVFAHFNEQDKHCFFDEFSKGMGCTDDGYCLGYTGENAKWNVIPENGSDTPLDRLEYNDGYIAIKSSAARGANKQNVTLMSTAVAGTRGSLKAQFRPSRLLGSNMANLPSTVANSGFFIHASETGSNGLFLTIYLDKDSKVVARLLDNAEPKNVYEKFLKKESESLVMAQSEPLVTLTVDVVDNRLTVSTIKERYYGAAPEIYTAVFELTTYSPSGEYVGVRLADPSFKLYDIGWKSDSYYSECWDTFPTLSCSFKGSYAGAVVPKGKDVLPWVGLSSWFDAKGCNRQYYYQGDDASCGASTNAYAPCSPYNFSEPGVHGFTQGNVEMRTARAGVGDCFNLDEKDRFLAQSEWAHCGAFWVGEQRECRKSVSFLSDAVSNIGSTVTNFNLSTGTANLRSSDIFIELENNNERRRIEIYLLSQEDIGAPISYSKSGYLTFEAGGSKVASIKAEDLFEADGFDPEKVFGIAVLVLEGSSVNVVNLSSSCPNQPSCKDSKAEYKGDHWLVTTKLKNYVNTVGSFVVAESNGYITPDFTCSNDGCNYEEGPDNTATYKFEIEDNPYASHMGDKYKFSVQLTTKDGEGLSCGATNEVEIKSVTPSCIGFVGSPNRMVGDGLPQFKYKMSNCPPTGCPWKITLENAGWVADIANGSTATIGDASSTASDAANTDTPLEAGFYKFILQKGSGDNAIDFEPCTSSVFEITEETIPELTLDCPDTATTKYTAPTASVPVTVGGCGDGYTCSWNISGTGTSVSQSGSNLSISGATAGSEYVVTLTRGTESVTCPVKFKEAGSGNIFANCSWCEWNNSGQCVNITSTYITKQSAVFKATDFTGYTTDNIKIYLYNEDDEKKGENTNFYAPTGTYTRSLSDMSTVYNESKNETYTLKDESGNSICTADLVVKNPVADCKVSKTSVEQNKSVTFSVAGTGWTPGDITYKGVKLYFDNTRINTWGDFYGNNSISFDYSPTVIGEHKFVLKGFDDKATLCEKTVTVAKPKPTCSVEDFSVQAGTSSITIDLTSTGCTSGTCSYTITGGTKGGTSGSGYLDSDGSLPTTIIGEDNANSTPVPYTLKLTDGDNLEGSCNFNITYTASGSGEVVEFENPDGNNFPQAKDVDVGSCLKLTGTWANAYYLPYIQIQCGGTTGIKITYGEKSNSGDYTVVLQLGEQLFETSTKATFVSNVCVSATGDTKVNCAFGGYNP